MKNAPKCANRFFFNKAGAVVLCTTFLVGAAVCQRKFTEYIPNIYYTSSVATVVQVLFNKADAIFAKVQKFIEANADNLTGIRLFQIKQN